MSAIDRCCSKKKKVNTSLFTQAPVTTLILTGLSYVSTAGQGDDRLNLRTAFPQLGEIHFMRYQFYRHVSGLCSAMQFTVWSSTRLDLHSVSMLGGGWDVCFSPTRLNTSPLMFSSFHAFTAVHWYVFAEIFSCISSIFVFDLQNFSCCRWTRIWKGYMLFEWAGVAQSV